MTWATRLKLVFGTIVVLAIVAALTYVFIEREGTATSQSATISAEVLPVGSDYGGKVVTQYVEPGDEVEIGDLLFTIDSLQRQRDLEADAKAEAAREEDGEEDGDSADSDSGDGADAGEGDDPDATTALASTDDEFSPLWNVVATVDGTVADIPVGQGGYVPAGGIVAHVYREGSLFVSADFLLTSRDFERLESDAAVTVQLPDRSEFPGTVETIQVATEDGDARAYVTVESEHMTNADPVGLTAPGTPAQATIELRNDGPLAALRDSTADFLQRIGL